jgi:(2Fe-2S) ferredoxin
MCRYPAGLPAGENYLWEIMKIEKLNSTLQLHICNYQREGDEDCYSKGAKPLTDELKAWAKTNYPKDIKIYRSGCLGKCSQGIAISCYPQKETLIEVNMADVQEIRKGLEEALEKLKS